MDNRKLLLLCVGLLPLAQLFYSCAAEAANNWLVCPSWINDWRSGPAWSECSDARAAVDQNHGGVGAYVGVTDVTPIFGGEKRKHTSQTITVGGEIQDSQYWSNQFEHVCFAPYAWDDGTHACVDTCTWPETPNVITGQCEPYDDCPAGQVPDPANPGQCTDDCVAGVPLSANYGLFWAADEADLSASVDGPVCISGCSYDVTSLEFIQSWPGQNCGYFNGRQVCESAAGYTLGVDAVTNGAECSGSWPGPTCPTCGSPPDPGQDPDAPQDPPDNDPPPPPGEPQGDTSTDSETVDNGDGTTTTTTTTTYPDGSTTTTSITTNTSTGATSSTTTTQPGQSEDEDKPEPKREYQGGGCGAAPFCGGDAIDCAIARHLWEAKCALDSEGVDVDQVAVEEAAGGVGDFESLIETETVDASDPLSLGGYIENPAPGCPADYSVSVMGADITFSWHWLCEFLLLIRGIVMAAGILVSGLIYYRGLVQGA